MPTRREEVWSMTHGVNPAVENRWDTFTPEFDYSSMSGILDKLYESQKSKITDTTNKARATAQRGTASRLLSGGIDPGSSMYNDIIANSGEDALEKGFGALTDIGTARISQELPIMNTANQMKFATTQQAQSVDLQNFINELRKMGMLQGQVNDWEQMDMAKENQPGFLEDLFTMLAGGTKTAASLGWQPFKS